MSHSTKLTISHSFETLDGSALTSATGGVAIQKRKKMFKTLKKIIGSSEGAEKSGIDKIGR